MLSSCVVIAVILCSALQSNEAAGMSLETLATSEQLQDTQLAVGAFEAAQVEMKKEAEGSMTLHKAIELIGHQKDASHKHLAFIQQQLGTAPATGYAGVQKGQDMLNEMIEETKEKLDLEQQTCANFIRSQKHQIWLTIQQISMYNADAAAAREAVLAAQAEIERLTDLLPQLESSLEAHNRKCGEDIAGLKEQLKIILGDIDVMTSVLKLTECNEQTLFLQHDNALGTAAAKVNSTEARQLLQEGVDEACGDEMPMESPPSHHRLHDHSVQSSPSPVSLAQISANPAEVEAPKQRAKCTLSKKSCKRLRDKFLQIQSGIESKRGELMAELASLHSHCEDERNNLESQISDAETDLKSEQTALASATKQQNDAERHSKLKNEEKEALIKELVRMIKLCLVNTNNFMSEECALRKIRGELEQMKGHTNPAFIQDCEVTDWQAGECSAPCGGGTQTLLRAVSVHPTGGAKCPPLEMKRACNGEECPVNCELGDWTEWSDCSAECNGGVKEKIRNIEVVPQFHGDSCGETSVTESCNVQSCDKDCVLSDWTGWSECSKDCDGGLSTRTKNVVEPKEGSGQCAAHDVDMRLEYQVCNEASCEGNVTCESLLDVVLLLDGSGSLGTQGWEQTKKAGQMIVESLHGGENHVKVSVILFGGPRYWSQYYACTGATQGATPDLKTDCGIDIVQHFTADMKEAATVIKNLNWPATTTLTSQVLATAQSELSLGRKEANSLVIVITDGRPLNPMRTGEMATKLKESSRLMFVPVTNNVPLEDVKKWASTPASENVIQVADFTTLADPSTITTLIANMCPKLKHTP